MVPVRAYAIRLATVVALLLPPATAYAIELITKEEAELPPVELPEL